MEVYETVKLIGSGAFGQVYLVRHKREDKLYVNKKIKTRDMNQKDRENTENEVRLLQKLRHSNIVAYKDSYMDREQFLNIVMIHCEGGDMHNKIKNQKGKNFPEEQILDWLAQMALALFYLHEKKILHRDLKTQNIFLKHGRVRLGDFGIAKVLDSTRDFANTCIGTPYYMSPELFKYKPYSYKSDVWAFGCVLYEMCNLRHAFDAQSLNALAVKIMKGSYPPINSTYSKGLRDMIGKMLQLNPKNRPSILEIINVSIVKRRVVNYFTEILSGNYPEANLINDVDDVYFDSLRDQAQKLGVLKMINQSIQKPGQSAPVVEEQQRPPKRTSSRQPVIDKTGIEVQNKAKKELLKQISEKNRIEEEIKRLEKKKMVRSSSTSINANQPQIPSSQAGQGAESRQNTKKTQEGDRKDRGDRSYSLEGDNSVNRRKPHVNPVQPTPQSKSSVNSIRNEIKKVRQQSDSSSTSSTQAESEISVPQSKGKNQSSRPSYDYSNMQNFPTEPKKEFIKPQGKQQEEFEPKRKVITSQDSVQPQRQRIAQQKVGQYRSRENVPFLVDEEERQLQNSFIHKRGSLQSLDQKKANSINDDFSLDLNERESFDQKTLTDHSQNAYNSEKYAPPMQSDDRSYQQQPQQGLKMVEEIKVQEEFGMEEDPNEGEEEVYDLTFGGQTVIMEEDNEESGGEEEEDQSKIEQKIELMRTKLKEKTVKINTIKEALNQSKRMATLQRNQTDFQEDDDDDQEKIIEEAELDDNVYYEEEEEPDGKEDPENEDDYDENEGEVVCDNLVINNPQYFKIQDRIKLFRHRCEASLGIVIFEKAYDFLKANQNKLSVEEVRKQLNYILSEENIGFWHLIDQILFLEDLSLTIPQQIEK